MPPPSAGRRHGVSPCAPRGWGRRAAAAPPAPAPAGSPSSAPWPAPGCCRSTPSTSSPGPIICRCSPAPAPGTPPYWTSPPAPARSAAVISRHLRDTRRGSGWGWRRTPTRWAVEYLFRSGALDCVGRTIQFQRLYLPADHPVPPIPEASPHAWPQSPEQAERAYSSQEALPLTEEEAVRGLAALAARALGRPIRRRSRTASGCGSDRCARRWPISSRPGSSRRWRSTTPAADSRCCCTTRPPLLPRSGPPLWSAPSTRSCSSGPGCRPRSTSTTGSRTTLGPHPARRAPTPGCTCTATASPPGSTSRRTARPECCECAAPTGRSCRRCPAGAAWRTTPWPRPAGG